MKKFQIFLFAAVVAFTPRHPARSCGLEQIRLHGSCRFGHADTAKKNAASRLAYSIAVADSRARGKKAFVVLLALSSQAETCRRFVDAFAVADSH